MSWAARRRFIILFILGAIVVAVAGALLAATLHREPTCSDGIQNQDEAGVDCGGSCAFLCIAGELPPTVLYTKAISNGAGRIDVIASIENKNLASAAKNVPYRVQLYSPDQTLITEVSGMLDLPPGSNELVFIPGLAFGKEKIANAFLEIDPTAPAWYALPADPRIVPRVSNTKLTGTTKAPRVEATLLNPTITPLTNVRVIVTVQDVGGTVLAASSTVVPSIPAQGSATAVFTWNGAFAGTPTLIGVAPVIPLP